MKKWMIILGALMLSMTACTAKKRDNALPYGADRNLLKISDFDGAEFDLVTDSVSAKSSSNSSSIKVMDDTGKVQYHDFATYKTKADLMDNSPFIGKPATTYKVKYIFEDKKLKIYKVGQENDFSFEEKAAAQSMKLNDGRLATPLVAYGVTYFSTDNSRNENNEVTNKLELVDQESKNGATYFRIEKSSKELAEFIKKDLHFDANFFDGEWYFAASIVSQNYKMKAAEDRDILEWVFRQDSAKVKVKKEENRLSFYALNMDSKIRGNLAKREENQNVVLSFPAAWKQYRMSPAGRGTSVKEQEDTSKVWDQRTLIKLDPSKISMPTLNFKHGAANDDEDGSASGLHIKSEMNADLRDVQIGEQKGRRYFSFLVYMQDAKALVRYAFLESKSRNDTKPYESKIYLKEDKKIFGFFSTDIRALKTADKMNETDYVDSHLVNRFNPNLSVIQFNPSEQTPEWTMKIAEKATLAWNNAFKAAGTGIHIEFNSSKVHVGDLRYNVINILDDPDGNEPWWGFGPNVADVETGEIISATANVNISDMVYRIRSLLQSYIRSKAGETSGNFIASIVLSGTDIALKKGNGFLNIVTDQPSLLVGMDLSPSIKKDSLEGISYLPIFDRKTAKGFEWTPVKMTKKSGNLTGAFNGRLPENNFQLEYENVVREIQDNKECSALQEYSNKLEKQQSRLSSAAEKTILESCVISILEPRAVATLVHEMGHNFGLRHNFYGNTDQSNFWPAANGKIQTRSSSIMEYSHFDEDTLMTPGFYDVAAIKWGYTGKLLTRDGLADVTSYDSKQPIQAQKANLEMRQFKYCTDEEAQGIGYDPMCALHDKGTTAIETVSSYIKHYNYSIAGLRNLEKGRILTKNPEAIAIQNANDIFVPVKRFYDYFRLLIEQEYPSHGYLETEDAKSFPVLIQEIAKNLQSKAGINVDFNNIKRDDLNKLVNQYYKKGMTRDEKKFIEFLDYKEASELAYTFLRSVAFMPDYYCLIKYKDDKENPVSLVSFAVLQRTIYSSTGASVTTCKDTTVQLLIAKIGGSVLLDVGNPVDTLVRDLDISKMEDTPIAMGTIYDRANAAILLGKRGVTLLQNVRANLLPNFYDEPAKRAELEQLIIDRMVHGVDSKSLGIEAQLKDLGIKNFQSLVFEAEKPLLNLLYTTMVQGEQLPGKPFINSKRMERFVLHRAYLPDQLKTPGAKQFSLSGADYFALPENEVVYKLIDTAHELVRVRETKVPDQKVIDAVKKFMEGRLISKADQIQKFTAGQFNSILKEFEAEAETEKDPILGKGEELLSVVLMEEQELVADILKPMIQGVAAAGNKAEDIKKANDEFRQVDLIAASKKFKKTFSLYKETIGERIDSAKEDLLQAIESYKANENELNAQTDMLIQAITLSSGE